MNASVHNAYALLEAPICADEQLGLPIPDSIHAVSVALPRWQDVVDYEEKAPGVMTRLRSGYPRFFVHPLVAEIGRRLSPDAFCLPFPSASTAETASDFVMRSGGAQPRLLREGELTGVAAADEAGADALRAFWQHTGMIVTSRQAEAHLAGRSADAAAAASVRESLRKQLAGFYECDSENIFLQPTGMGAIFDILRAVNAWRPGRATAQLGFPYVDTLKLQQRLGAGAVFIPEAPGLSIGTLSDRLVRESPAACFCEVPGNPLLQSLDLGALSPRLRAAGIPLIVDDVVATPYNVDLQRHADVVVTSLTKYIAGTGDVMGGAVVLNARSPFYAALRRAMRAIHQTHLWWEDAAVLDRQARGFPERMRQHNANGLRLAERLRAHPAVARVWYPKWECADAYESVRRPGGGWGNLLSFLPHRAEVNAALVYDALAVSKGPTLGTIFSLACPFTLLAHYAELDWAERCGVSRYLIRVSVGLEDPAALWERFERALAACL